ncbi:MAG TPA: hypothetical protein VKD90_13005 [Gemmataceae bacterium]|nr:hypothetical protein [Gemmataceae bacterium]
MIHPSTYFSCRLTTADHARLSRLRDRCRGLIDRAHGSIDRSAALLRRLPWHPEGPAWPSPEAGLEGRLPVPTVVDADPADLWECVTTASLRARSTVERAGREVAQAELDVARARELRQESLALRLRHLALGRLPPPALTTGPEGAIPPVPESGSPCR